MQEKQISEEDRRYALYDGRDPYGRSRGTSDSVALTDAARDCYKEKRKTVREN